MTIVAQEDADQDQTLYRFYDASDALLYIGITGDPGIRWYDHAKLKGWWRDVMTVKVEHFDTRKEVEAAEKSAIVTERPVHNITYNSDKRRLAAVVIGPPTDPAHFSGSCWKCAYAVTGKHRGHLPTRMEWAEGNLTIRYRCIIGHEWKEEWEDAIYRIAGCNCDWCLDANHARLEMSYPQ
ncbi:putative GIY-YIG superfamily endonuclease [Actinoplanes campanulatus]|uniref:Putative GIY-YIG superfamily endonuclease n=1 Tax=Actinoplanes campanulatus TaxID=113559 RepID=A0A7W5AMW6_9ACTN|nr:GIY-YIG nuclease family protein [Actinoplanes campanulatus]MBB3099005.1 putative GIY-YIG superfamily endonuclease [Actinoplanes campanulatus]GGN39484.1 hypothetical protein GCM10010109_67450 [Actinoplanes campanulatus]GID40165.1 hypothetical protein Aca09nite_66710 [Actinoplanes campanulatus]